MTAPRRLVPTVILLIAILGLAGVAAARPGGGESYSGGGGHSSGGGDGGVVIFELVYWLIRIIIVYPAIGLPILALVIGYAAPGPGGDFQS